MASACSSLQCRKRRSPVRNSRSRVYDSWSSRRGIDIINIVPRYIGFRTRRGALMPAPTPPRRLLLLSAIAVVLGLAGGGAAYVLIHLIGLLTNLALLHRFGWKLPSFRGVVFGPTV